MECPSGGEGRVQRADRVADFAIIRDLSRPAASCDFAEVAHGGMVDAAVWNLFAQREQHLAEFAQPPSQSQFKVARVTYWVLPNHDEGAVFEIAEE